MGAGLVGPSSPWAVVEAVNRAWTGGDPATIGQWFHPDMVIVGPSLERLAEGREACAQSYVSFVTHARVVSFETHDVHSDVFGDTAVVTYRYWLLYEAAGERVLDEGADAFVLVRADESWQAVWRVLLPGKSS